MNAHTKSARLTLCLTFLILITVIAAAVTLPWLTDWYICKTGRNKELRSVIMTVCYICLPAALAALLAAGGYGHCRTTLPSSALISSTRSPWYTRSPRSSLHMTAHTGHSSASSP